MVSTIHARPIPQDTQVVIMERRAWEGPRNTPTKVYNVWEVPENKDKRRSVMCGRSQKTKMKRIFYPFVRVYRIDAQQASHRCTIGQALDAQ